MAQHIEHLTGDLEQGAHPALDALTLKVHSRCMLQGAHVCVRKVLCCRTVNDRVPCATPRLQINTSNLERVRRIKNRMVRLTTRVETVSAGAGPLAGSEARRLSSTRCHLLCIATD